MGDRQGLDARERRARRLNAVVVDDEPLARRGLKRMLDALPQVRVVGVAGDLAEARALVRDCRPDVVFLDIQLAGETGFELLPDLPAKTEVVFVTAHDEYAIRAFEVNALDYLLKPVDSRRLAAAVARIPRPRVPLPRPPGGRLWLDDRVLVSEGRTRRLVPVSEIHAIRAQGDYSEVFWDASRNGGLVHRTMDHWEDMLPADRFLRIHRETIVNLAEVQSFEPAPDGGVLLRLRALPDAVKCSRRLAPEFHQRMRERSGLE